MPQLNDKMLLVLEECKKAGFITTGTAKRLCGKSTPSVLKSLEAQELLVQDKYRFGRWKYNKKEEVSK